MVTESQYMVNGKFMGAVTLYGLSTDSKPTAVGNGSVFIEVDTGNGFFFDAEGGTWYPEVDTGTKKSTRKKV